MDCFPPRIMRSSWQKKVVTEQYLKILTKILMNFARGSSDRMAVTIQLTPSYI